MENKEINIHFDKLTSDIFGYPVVDWHCLSQDISIEQIISVEQQSVLQYNTKLFSVQLTDPSLSLIANFEACGFKFIQCRLNIQKQLTPDSYNLYPYAFIRVSDKKQLDDLLNYCNKLKFDDRYSIDPSIGKALSLKRNKQFLRNSFDQKDERIYVLMNQTRNTIDGFRSYKFSKGVASVMLGAAVKNDRVFEYDKILNYLEMAVLYEQKIKTLRIVVSSTNYNEINRYISELDYRVVNSSMVLRKIIE